jgi:hypothetical protein
MKLFKIAAAVVCVTLFVGTASAQAGGTGPDVIVGDLTTPANYGSSGNIAAFAIGTVSCNIGTQTLLWQANNSNHPVIGQTLYRLKGGRFEQIGQSWLKHGFTALAQSLCATCQNPGTGSLLGVNCSDPYSASLNGSQSGLGPKTEVNAATGAFTYPPANPAYSGNIARRLQVAHADLDPALNGGAIYIAEAQYVTPDDAAAGNKNNNASYRRATVTQGTTNPYQLGFTSANPTVRQKPAVLAWRDLDPNVTITNVDVANDGRIIVAFRQTALANGNFQYEYAIQNLSSHRSVRGITIPVTMSTTITNLGFHDVPYHSAEPFTGQSGTYTGTDWPGQIVGNSVVWQTESYATNQRANAIRWGTTYNFRFESNGFPGDMVIELFRPGTPTTVTAPSTMPAFALTPVGTPPATMPPGTPTAVDIQAVTLTGLTNPATATLHVSVDGAGFAQQPMIQISTGVFRGTLPALSCFHTAAWYMSMQNSTGAQTITWPPLGQSGAFVTSAEPATLITVFNDNLEGGGQPGWSVTNGPLLTDGSWDATAQVPVAAPVTPGPPAASGGAGKCFMTKNLAVASDVDGDETRLATPSFNLAGYPDARLRYALWYDNDDIPGSNDVFRVDGSVDGGATWTTIDQVSTVAQWQTRSVRLGQYFTNFSNNMRLRFVASDLAPAHTVEAAIDNIVVEICPTGAYLSPLATGILGQSVGGPFSTLLVNGSDGGGLHRVDVPVGASVVLSVDQPSFTAAPCPFVVSGYIGVPTAADVTPLPGSLGSMVFPPAILAPTNPLLFTLVDGLGLGGAIIPGVAPAPPFVLSFPAGIPNAMQITLQVVQVDPSNAMGIAVGNAVIMNVQ